LKDERLSVGCLLLFPLHVVFFCTCLGSSNSDASYQLFSIERTSKFILYHFYFLKHLSINICTSEKTCHSPCMALRTGNVSVSNQFIWSQTFRNVSLRFILQWKSVIFTWCSAGRVSVLTLSRTETKFLWCETHTLRMAAEFFTWFLPSVGYTVLRIMKHADCSCIPYILPLNAEISSNISSIRWSLLRKKFSVHMLSDVKAKFNFAYAVTIANVEKGFLVICRNNSWLYIVQASNVWLRLNQRILA
jgi:hypothetical protein